MRGNILVIEDEADLRELLSFNLAKEGFKVLESGDGREGLVMASRHKVDLVLLDVMLPGLDGFSVCRELKRNEKTSHIPVLMLTARNEEVDRIVGLELGADDYVGKPFSVRELILRVKAVLRRQGGTDDGGRLEAGPLALDTAAHEVRVFGVAVDFTATEFRLLEYLMRHAGTVRTREHLLDAVWGYQFEGYARTVDTHVRRVRAKLGDAADMLETLRGVGYRIRAGRD